MWDAPGFAERLCGGDVSDAVSGGSALKHGSWHCRTFTSGRWFMLPLTTHTYGTGFHSAWAGGGGGVTVNFSFLLLLLLLLWSLTIWPFCRYSYPELTNTIYIPCKWPFLYSWIFFTEAARVKCLAQGCDSSLPIWESVLQRQRPRLLTIMLHCYLPLPDFKTRALRASHF